MRMRNTIMVFFALVLGPMVAFSMGLPGNVWMAAQQSQQQDQQQSQQRGQQGQQPLDQQMMQKWSDFTQQCLGSDHENANQTLSGTIQSIDTMQADPNADAPSGLRLTVMASSNGSRQQNGHMDGRQSDDQQSDQMGREESGYQQSRQSQSGQDQKSVYLGPSEIIPADLNLSEGAQVQFKGAECEIEGEQVFVATSIQMNGQQYELSQKNGSPKWESQSDQKQQKMNGQQKSNGEQREGQQSQRDQHMDQQRAQRDQEMGRQQDQQDQQSQRSSQRGQQQLQAEAKLAMSVEDREPVQPLEQGANVSGDSVVFWTTIEGVQQGESVTIKHLWIHQNDTVATVDLPVNGPTWRTWSYKTMDPQMTGEWKVVAVDPQGQELASTTFTYEGSQQFGQANGQQRMNGEQRDGQQSQRDQQQAQRSQRDQQQAQRDQQQSQQSQRSQRQDQQQQGQQQMGQSQQAMQKWSDVTQQCLGADHSKATERLSGTIQSIDTIQAGQDTDMPSGLRFTVSVSGNGSQQQSGQMDRQPSGDQQSQQSQGDQQSQQKMVYLGPADQMPSGLNLSEGSQIQLTGAECEIANERMFIAHEIQSNGQQYVLNQQNGSLKWESQSGQKQQKSNGQQQKSNGKQQKQQSDTTESGSGSSPSRP